MKQKIISYIILFSCLSGLLAGCSFQTVQRNTWSIFLYLCGSNLETKMGSAGKNIDEILSADLPDHVNVVIQTGGAKKWRSHDIPSDSINRWLVKDGRLSLLESLPQASMGEEKTFSDFLSYGVTNYPADKMCVIVWDHGSIDGVANDENYHFDALTLPEMGRALKSVSKQMNGRFELFGFDACLMANYETACMLSPYARYLLASEEIEPSSGWDYAALFDAIASDPSISAGKLGKAVCDGYYAKCKANGKEATATLSVVDLSKLEGVQKAFETMALQTEENSVQVKGIQTIAQSARNSQKYGGTSEQEGYSNLVDLGHFAENAVDVEGSKQLLDALEEAVVYQVNGPQKSKSSGLSFYYPLHLDPKKFDVYYHEICPSQNYRVYLKTVYENMPENPIVFEDYGSKREDGSFGIKLGESARNYILSIDFLLLEFAAQVTDEAVQIDAVWLGQDNDCFKDWDTLDFHSNFRGIWLALNGVKLFVTPVESTEKYIIFTAPILLNGERSSLRFAFLWDDRYENGGYYKILGAWNGIDPVTGMSDKEITPLKSSDDIQVCYYRESLTVTSSSGSPEGTPMEEIFLPVPKGEYVISEEPLSEKNYIYQFVVTDIFGGKHYSHIAYLEMTKSAEELREHPLPDGVYAAVPDDIGEFDEPIAYDDGK